MHPPSSSMIRILFLIRSFERGGAERQLIELMRGMDKSRFDVTVATFYPGGGLLPEVLCIPGVKYICLEKKGRWDVAAFLVRLRRVLKTLRPQIVHGYLAVANELTIFARCSVGSKAVWGVRASMLETHESYWRVTILSKIASLLSRFSHLIISNSTAGLKFHAKNGYPRKRMEVVPNGIDSNRFHPQRSLGEALRKEWGIERNQILIGRIGRLAPMKDYATFLKAARILQDRQPRARFICIGDGDGRYREEMLRLCRDLQFKHEVLWLPGRDDMPAVYNALDLSASSSSMAEGFPNVICEAMACAVPCASTDVGDTRQIIGDTGEVVPVGDADRLAGALEKLINGDLPAQGAAARARIEREFSTRALVERTQDLLTKLVATEGRT
jgi:glycosyltransferase involved in cell wall biosynthesis